MNNKSSGSLFGGEERLDGSDSFSDFLQNVSLDDEDEDEQYTSSGLETNPFEEFPEYIPYAERSSASYNLPADFLDGMNPEQKQAVLYDEGSLLVLAGAGSGKTRVITHRFAYLVDKYGLGVHNILCVTFTNKAAAEMKERIGTLLGIEVKGAWIRTFHSMCTMILREHSPKIGYLQDFTIYDAVDSRNTIKKIMEKLNIDPKNFPDKAVARIISSAKEELIGPEEYAHSVRSEFEQVCAEVYKHYVETLKINQAMDFGDLISNTVMLLERNPDVLERYRRQWRFIMADEFQDTNKPQYLLLSLLSSNKKNICVVGDDDQSIYAWRGARVENIYQFQREFNAEIIRLEKNYRSCGNILTAANAVVKSIKGRMPKTLKAERENGEKIIVASLGDDRLQAAFIYQEMKKLMTQGLNYKDFAILYRTNAQSRVIEEVLTRHQVPHKIYGGQRFFDRAEIKDILSYLRIIVNPRDREAFDRIVNVPKRKIGDSGKRKIQEFVELTGDDYHTVCSKASQINGLTKVSVSMLENLAKILSEIKESIPTTLPSQIIKILIESTRYFEDYLVAEYGTYEAEGRFDNIQELVNAVKVFERANAGSSIADYLREASLLSSVSDDEADNGNSVSLMTIHSAKGLEFPIVFLVGVTEGILPLSSNSQEDLDEEKRLFYVAVTRAMNKLYISYEKQSLRYGEIISNEKSHFLEAVPSDVVEEYRDSGASPAFSRDQYTKKSYSGKSFYSKRGSGTAPEYSKKIDTSSGESSLSTAGINLQKISSLSEIAVGTEVFHHIFGKGITEYVSEAMIRVSFERFGTQVLMGNTISNLSRIVS
ncbi:MAG: ATP-dependent helicase [Brevinemataceae bacterium]